MTLLASSFQCEAASGSVRLDNVEVEVISKQGAVLEKYEYQNEVLQMDVRGSSMVKVRRHENSQQVNTTDHRQIIFHGYHHLRLYTHHRRFICTRYISKSLALLEAA